MNKTYVIGDIHGGLKALVQLISKSALAKNDTLIFLGDYVDGWSESAQVIDYLIDLEKQYKCVFIKGNHDVYCCNYLKTKIEDANWLRHGGLPTIRSYEKISDENIFDHINFFERLQNYYIDDENRLFIHAGFTSMHGPEQEMYDSNFSWDRTLWEMALTMDKRIKKDSKLYPKRLLLFHEIYIGHTPTLNYDITTPMQGCNVWNIDTGAGFYGPLTMMDIDTKSYIQSDALDSLYPDERGRNKTTFNQKK